MEMTEIRKQSLTAVEGVTEQIVSLAAQARELLGYDVLGKQTGAIQQMELTELQTALKELDIEIMFPADVEKYQRERQIEQTKINFEKWVVEFAKGGASLARWNRFDGPAWTDEKIAEYRQPIPEFVLAKAVQIKQRMPECEIYVESLQDHPDPFLIVATATANRYDTPKERYYVEVWAEPKFEGRL